jgi:hypothetical protein
MTKQDKPQVFGLAATGQDDEDQDELAGMTEVERKQQADMDELFSAYGHWCRTRGFFGPPPVTGNLLGKLTTKSRARGKTGGPDAACSAQLSALHLAVIAQPAEALDRRVFTLHYLYNVASVKQSADALGISRNHWYRLLRAFRSRVISSANTIMSDNLAAAENLQHRGGTGSISDDSD